VPKKKDVACDICGRTWPAEQIIYSTVTGAAYCPVPEWQRCVKPEAQREL
jgi:hypothetical protein